MHLGGLPIGVSPVLFARGLIDLVAPGNESRRNLGLQQDESAGQMRVIITEGLPGSEKTEQSDGRSLVRFMLFGGGKPSVTSTRSRLISFHFPVYTGSRWVASMPAGSGNEPPYLCLPLSPY